MRRPARGYRGVSFAVAFAAAGRWPPGVGLSRYDRLFEDHTVFSGVGYTEAHIIVPGLLLVALALVLGAVVAVFNAIGPRRLVDAARRRRPGGRRLRRR